METAEAKGSAFNATVVLGGEPQPDNPEELKAREIAGLEVKIAKLEASIASAKAALAALKKGT